VGSKLFSGLGGGNPGSSSGGGGPFSSSGPLDLGMGTGTSSDEILKMMFGNGLGISEFATQQGKKSAVAGPQYGNLGGY
jgi:hypothetical protein